MMLKEKKIIYPRARLRHSGLYIRNKIFVIMIMILIKMMMNCVRALIPNSFKNQIDNSTYPSDLFNDRLNLNDGIHSFIQGKLVIRY